MCASNGLNGATHTSNLEDLMAPWQGVEVVARMVESGDDQVAQMPSAGAAGGPGCRRCQSVVRAVSLGGVGRRVRVRLGANGS